WKDGGSVEVSWNASSAFPRFVMTNGTTIVSPDVATYWARTSATSTLATRSTTRKTVSPAGGAANGGRVGATGGGLRPGFPGTGLGAGGFIAGVVSGTPGAFSARAFSRAANCRQVCPYMELRGYFDFNSRKAAMAPWVRPAFW